MSSVIGLEPVVKIWAGMEATPIRSQKTWPCTSGGGYCNTQHTDYGGVNESLGYILRLYAGKGSLTTFAEVKQMSKERGFNSRQGLYSVVLVGAYNGLIRETGGESGGVPIPKLGAFGVL